MIKLACTLVLLAAAYPTARYLSTSGGFQVAFPQAPREQVKVQDGEAGRISTHMLTADSGAFGYLVSWADHPEARGQRAVDRLAQTPRSVAGTGKLLSEQAIWLDGHPGVEFRFEKEGMRVAERAFAVGPRLFQLMVVGPPGEAHGRAASTFFGSFELVQNKRKKRN